MLIAIMQISLRLLLLLLCRFDFHKLIFTQLQQQFKGKYVLLIHIYIRTR